ncbi:hypothetical protein BBJ28_00024345, partial [Nothophytophthora sp. Chile5]
MAHFPCRRLGRIVAVLGILAPFQGANANTPKYVQADDGSSLMRVLYQTDIWSDPHIHYSGDSGDWTTAPGIAMVNSTFDGYSASDGWFEYELENTTTLVFDVNDGVSTWDNNDGSNYFLGVPGTWSLVSAINENTTAQAAQEYLNTSGYTVTTVKESGSSLVIELKQDTTSTTDTYGDDIATLKVEVTKTTADS